MYLKNSGRKKLGKDPVAAIFALRVLILTEHNIRAGNVPHYPAAFAADKRLLFAALGLDAESLAELDE